MGEPDKKEKETGETYRELKKIALEEFPGTVNGARIEREPGETPRNLRIFLTDGSFLDIWISGNDYSYHRESENIIRWDNAPHHDTETHPHHVHREGEIESSDLEGNPKEDIRKVLTWLGTRT